MAALTTIAAITALAAAGGSIAKTLTTKAPKTPVLPAAPQVPDQNLLAAQQASIAQTRARALAGGTGTHGGTLLTGPTGVVDAAPTTRKTLLGY